MYFPILRGRQFELLALRECVNKDLLCNKIIPIVEPVKVSSTYTKTVDSFIKADIILRFSIQICLSACQ